MKDSSRYGAELKKLLNRLERSYQIPSEVDAGPLITELVLASLSAHTTEARARTGLGKLESSFVDYNELRVSRSAEIAEVLGKTYPRARETASQIITMLNSIYDKADSLSLEHLRDLGKREAKMWLEEVAEIDAYVVGRVMLRGLGAHAVPVNEAMLEMLRREEVVDPEADVAAVQGFLERQISVQEVVKDYQLLREHTDNPVAEAAKSPAKKKAAKKVVKKASEKKPAAKKKTTKKKAARA